MRKLLKIWRAAPLASAILGLALIAAAWFAVRGIAFWIYWNDPAHQFQEVRGWMTPGYIAQSWDVPIPVVRDAIGLENGDHRIGAIDRYAVREGLSTDALIAEIEAAIAAHRSGAE